MNTAIKCYTTSDLHMQKNAYPHQPLHGIYADKRCCIIDEE